MANRYNLQGTNELPQVEPGAAFWLRNSVPRALQLEEIRRQLDQAVPEFNEAGSTAEANDLDRVRELATQVEDEQFFNAKETLSIFLRHARYVFRPLPSGSTQPSPSPVYPPPGAVYNRRNPINNPFLRNGSELARLFEAETPGLWHRHVLNILLDPTIPDGPGQMLSPPRQALIWAALDVAISSALQAAWYFKWFSLEGRRISFRRRPWEADNTLPVLFAYMVGYDAQGNIIKGALRNDAPVTPGTPRHPAYPSGHSTYSAAASQVLGCLFPTYRSSFNALANNIGRARLWAGVHWFQDHTTGQLIGKRVGELVIAQLNASGIAARPTPSAQVPDLAALRALERSYYTAAREGQLCQNSERKGENFCRGVVSFDQQLLSASPGEGRMNPGSMIEDPAGRSEPPPADEREILLNVDEPAETAS
jgi:membrane-associated phospholipid phosphatase